MSSARRVVQKASGAASKVFATSARLAALKEASNKPGKFSASTKSLSQKFNEYKSLSQNFANQLKQVIANPSGGANFNSAGAESTVQSSVSRYAKPVLHDYVSVSIRTDFSFGPLLCPVQLNIWMGSHCNDGDDDVHIHANQ
jgi:transglutaminase/protease-like cytokinesis protein 3